MQMNVLVNELKSQYSLPETENLLVLLKENSQLEANELHQRLQCRK